MAQSAICEQEGVEMSQVTVRVADESHVGYAQAICDLIAEGARLRGTGIAKRSPEYVEAKMREGKAIIALDADGTIAGFCYIEVWTNEQYVANSGLIINPAYRGQGLATRVKTEAFNLTRRRYPNAKMFGLTTSAAVMKINSELGYRPVVFGELTQDDKFWDGCQSCPNYDILQRLNRKMCLCTGMLFDPNAKKKTPPAVEPPQPPAV